MMSSYRGEEVFGDAPNDRLLDGTFVARRQDDQIRSLLTADILYASGDRSSLLPHDELSLTAA